MSRQAAVATVQIDNHFTRATEWRFAPGAETGWHDHEWEYVVVPLTTGELAVETADGTSTSSLQSGASYTRPVPSRHNVMNPGAEEFVFIEVEIKS